MKSWGALFFVIFNLLNTASYADELEDKLNKILSSNWDKSYNRLACTDNLIKVLKDFDQELLNKAYVLHIFHKHIPYASITPLSQRLIVKDKIFKKGRWLFHGVLVVQNKVVDLDFTDQASVIGLNDYFKLMWKSNEVEHNFRFQIKKASLYTKFDADGDIKGSKTLSYDELFFTELFSKNLY